MKIYFEHDDLMLIDLKYLYIFPHWQFANFLARIEKLLIQLYLLMLNF